uniref:UDP-glucuronate decarboxylase n=1 Tax=Candidatus Methanophagaceae archaeon ANME-1 ERB6 TaxID=2759912 RepID=A0A7G9YYX4_9EURY|nr:GDP-L-fucose synthase [Methanosarcinales archaeon ANME-1 ERB6]
MIKTIVTGGAGFIGSYLCEYLVEKGHKVICVDNLITGRTPNLERIWKHKNFKFVEHDITEPFFTGDKIDYIYHLASPASPKDYLEHPIHTLKVGALGTYHMLGLAKEHGARFLLASTSEVYGDPKVNPQPEEYLGNVNPIGPRGVYDEAKRYAEAITMAYHRSHNVDTRIVRIFNTFGPRMRLDDGRAVPNFIGQALRGDPITVYGDGSQTRSFCFISDMVEAIYRLMMSDYDLPMNLGNPEELTILEFANLIKKRCKANSEIVYEVLPQDDPMQRKPDINKAKRILGWEPKVGLEEGLKMTIEWFKEKEE